MSAVRVMMIVSGVLALIPNARLGQGAVTRVMGVDMMVQRRQECGFRGQHGRRETRDHTSCREHVAFSPGDDIGRLANGLQSYCI